MDKNSESSLNEKNEEKVENELYKIKDICNEHNKHTYFIIQIVLSFISFTILYCQQYVLKNNIDIGLSIILIKYVGICSIITPILGWLGYFVEFKINNFKIFKKVKLGIWIIQFILVGIFIYLLL